MRDSQGCQLRDTSDKGQDTLGVTASFALMVSSALGKGIGEATRLTRQGLGSTKP